MYNFICGISGTQLQDGDDIVIFPIIETPFSERKSFKSSEVLYKMTAFGIQGKYNSETIIQDIQKDTNVTYIEQYFNCHIEEFIQTTILTETVQDFINNPWYSQNENLNAERKDTLFNYYKRMNILILTKKDYITIRELFLKREDKFRIEYESYSKQLMNFVQKLTQTIREDVRRHKDYNRVGSLQFNTEISASSDATEKNLMWEIYNKMFMEDNDTFDIYLHDLLVVQLCYEHLCKIIVPSYDVKFDLDYKFAKDLKSKY